MIDPIHSLAFSVQSNPGVYAVLIGSGVSRAAGIPTGWDVTLDLVRKLAAVEKEAPKPDPETWFRIKFGSEPDYSKLLDQLGKTQPDRQQILRRYWEPSDEERTAGEKEPTSAHHAIAALASRGFIKVIITTNFDRLTERALSAAGIEATVLSTEDQIEGAPPLDHIRHLVFKVHGDYLDIRIRNTTTELSRYPREVDQLLDRIFDEYGLIVCGWSGEWDPALQEALERAPARRYTTYWTTRRPPSAIAQRLIAHRRAEVIQIEDADTFFEKVKEDVTAIDEFSKPHPLSANVAVTKLKRYMPEPRHRIRLSDLIDDTVREILKATAGDGFRADKPEPTTPQLIAKRVQAYDGACSTLTAMAAVAGGWAESEHYWMWQRALKQLSGTKATTGVRNYTVWRDLQRYPATRLLYALGLGAVDRRRLEFLHSLLQVKVNTEQNDEMAAVSILAPSGVLHAEGEELLARSLTSPCKPLERISAPVTPLNRWLHDSLRGETVHVFHDEAHFTRVFDELEVLISLGNVTLVEGEEYEYHLPWTGCFFWRGTHRDRFLAEIRESLDAEGNDSPFVTSWTCGKTPDVCRERIEALEDKVADVGWDRQFVSERMRRKLGETNRR